VRAGPGRPPPPAAGPGRGEPYGPRPGRSASVAQLSHRGGIGNTAPRALAGWWVFVAENAPITHHLEAAQRKPTGVPDGWAGRLLRVHVDREARLRVLAAGRHQLDRAADR